MKKYIGTSFGHILLYIKIGVGIACVIIAIATGLWGIAAIGGVLFLSIFGSLSGFNHCCEVNEEGTTECKI